MSQYDAVLLLGSNLGEKENNLEEALRLLEGQGALVRQRSPVLNTAPVGFASTNNFCNIAVVIETDLSPVRLLAMLKTVEHRMGRTVDTAVSGGYADRVIDIDIVSFCCIVFESEKLQLPHYKHMYERDFSKTLLQSLTHKNNTI